MTLDSRHGSIVQLVAKFKQLSSAHVQELLFHEHASRTPCDRALKRLVQAQYLVRIERRMVGGAKGGSGLYVYALGRRGFYTHFDGPFNPPRSVNYHSIAIADAYVALKRLERVGAIQVLGYSTEPDSWASVDDIQLKPDFAVDIAVNGTKLPRVWLEVDMGTEGQKQLRTKLEDYWRAYMVYRSASDELPEFPRIIWVAVDAERVKEINWLLGEGSMQARSLFQVCTAETLPAVLLSQ